MQKTAATLSMATHRGSMAGTLQQKHLFGKWKQHYYVLTGSCLCRFKHERATAPSEEIELTATTEVVGGEGICGKKHSVAILNSNKSPLLLLAKDEQEYKAWYNALKLIIHTCSHGEKSQGSTKRHSFKENTEKGNLVSALEAVIEACVISDYKGNVVGFNQAAEQLFGYKKAEIIGENVKKLMPFNFARHHDDYLRNYAQTGNKKLIGIPRKVTAVRKDSSRVSVMISLGELTSPSCSSTASSSLSSSCSSEPTPAFVAIFRQTSSPSSSTPSTPSSEPSPLLTSPTSPSSTTSKSSTESSPTLYDELSSMMHCTLAKLTENMKMLKEQQSRNYDIILERHEEKVKQLEALEKRNQQLLSESMQLRNKISQLHYEIFMTEDLSKDLTKLLSHDFAFQEFHTFCKTLHSEECLLFLQEAYYFQSQYKHAERSSCSQQLSKDVMRIYNKYLKPRADMEINTGAQYIGEIHERITKCPSSFDGDMFDNLFKDCLYTIMPCFLKFSSTSQGRAIAESVQLIY